MFDGMTREEISRDLHTFHILVRRMRAAQKVDRHRETITQSGQRADAEDRVDEYLTLLALDLPGPPLDAQGAGEPIPT